MSAPDLGRVARHYTHSLGQHGPGARGVGWREDSDHRLRFDKLLALCDEPRATAVSVNDLGCGYGALYEFLVEEGVNLRGYRGYDISAEMLDEARKRIGDRPGVTLREGAYVGDPADYSFASGIFNVRFAASDELWIEHVFTTLRNLAEFSIRGLAFNLLSTYVDYREEHLFYGDPAVFFDFAKRELSRKVALLHDYPLYEWTILVKT